MFRRAIKNDPKRGEHETKPEDEGKMKERKAGYLECTVYKKICTLGIHISERKGLLYLNH